MRETASIMDSIPKDFLRALRQSGLEEYFVESAYVPQAEYLSWVAAAKLPETRRQRIRKAVVRLFAQWQEEMSAVRAQFNSFDSPAAATSSAKPPISATRRSA